MTAFFIDLTEPAERVLIASDTLMYTVTDRHAPIAVGKKVIAFPHIGGALFGSGLHEILLRVAAALLRRPDIATHEDVVAALPEILRGETATLAAARGIAAPDTLMLLRACWIGRSAASAKFEMVGFDNSEHYVPIRGFSGLIGIPNVSASYVPPGFAAIRSPEVRAMAAMRAIHRFTSDHADVLGMAPIGGDVVLTEINDDGITDRVVGRIDDPERIDEAIAATRNAAERGDYAGLNLINRKEDQPAALAEMRRRLAPSTAGVAAVIPIIPMVGTRQQRRAAERKTGRRAA